MQDQVHQVRRNFSAYEDTDRSGPSTEPLSGQVSTRRSEQTPLTQGSAAGGAPGGQAAASTATRKGLARQGTVYGMGEAGFASRHEEKEHRVKKKSVLRSEMKTAAQLPEYDANQWMLTTIFSWHGTVTPLVFQIPFYWLSVAIHATLALLEAYTDLDIIPGIDGILMMLPASLLTLQAVFYASQCYGRFFEMFGHTVGIGGSTMIWAGLVRLHVRDNFAVRWNAMRFILAASHLLYYRLDGGMDDDDWKTVRGRRLLTEKEHQIVLKYNGYAPFLLITWALQEVHEELREGTPETDRWRCEAYQRFEQCALDLRGNCSQITNLLKQPVPYAYFHLLNVGSVLTLSLIAYGFVGLASPYISIIAYMLLAFMILGIKQIAISMADPFGDDEVDFKLEKFLASTYQNALAHLGDTNTEALGTELPSEVFPPRPKRQSLAPQTSLMQVIDQVASDPSAAERKRPAPAPVKPSFSHLMTAHNLLHVGGEDASTSLQER